MYEYLKPVLGDELYTQFTEKMAGASGITLANAADGSWFPKHKFDDVNNRLKTANEDNLNLLNRLNDARQQLATAAENTRLVESLRADIAARDAQISQLALQYRAKQELFELGARNVDLVAGLIDMGKVTEQDGKLVGFTEQVEAIKQKDGYLFNDGTSQGGKSFGFGGSARQQSGGTPTADVNAAIRTAAGR